MLSLTTKNIMLRTSGLVASSKKIKSILELTDAIITNRKSFSVLKPSHETLIAFQSQRRIKIWNDEFSFTRSLHIGKSNWSKNKDEDKIQLQFKEFETCEKKNKKSFTKTVILFQSNFKRGQSIVDFIRIALNNMKDYGVHKDLEMYKILVNLLPKGPLQSKDKMMSEMFYHPKEQFVILQLLRQMGYYGVNPDMELGRLLVSIFGKTAHPVRYFLRSMYWSVKFKNKSPWPVPKDLPSDALILAKMAIERITTPDIQTEISIFQAEDIPESIDKTWIVSGQSRTQKKLLKKHSPTVPVIVEGGDIVWLNNKFVNYFVLKSDTGPLPYIQPEEVEDLALMQSIYFNPEYKEKHKTRSVHEQDEGTIYAVCATGTSSRDSLLSWVRFLQKNGNPILEKVPVLFRFKSPSKEVAPFSEALVTQEQS